MARVMTAISDYEYNFSLQHMMHKGDCYMPCGHCYVCQDYDGCQECIKNRRNIKPVS